MYVSSALIGFSLCIVGCLGMEIKHQNTSGLSRKDLASVCVPAIKNAGEQHPSVHTCKNMYIHHLFTALSLCLSLHRTSFLLLVHSPIAFSSPSLPTHFTTSPPHHPSLLLLPMIPAFHSQSYNTIHLFKLQSKLQTSNLQASKLHSKINSNQAITSPQASLSSSAAAAASSASSSKSYPPSPIHPSIHLSIHLSIRLSEEEESNVIF